MEEHIKLRLEYKKLIREGKKEEAQKILKKIWAKKSEPVTKEENKKEIVETKKQEKKKVSNFTSLSDLTEINGLGKKSLIDIKKQFSTLEDLKEAIVEDKVALRDDIVEKLKEVLI